MEKHHTASEEYMTVGEVAKKMGISRSYVSRLEKRAIAMLRKQYDQTPFSSF